MTYLVYDSTFEGLLTGVFDAYDLKLTQPRFVAEENFQPDVFADFKEVVTGFDKASRVWQGLVARLSPSALGNLYRCFLSEEPEFEQIIFSFIRYTFSSSKNIEHDFSHDAVIKVMQINKKVEREKHRFEAFVRFKKDKSGLFYALVSPDFNVLPLIKSHFENRYSDQRWLIYDTKRKYGIYCDLKKTEQVTFNAVVNLKEEELWLDEEEKKYQELWQDYFKSTNIPARKNMKLHKQHLPVRYWKYLTEKQVGIS